MQWLGLSVLSGCLLSGCVSFERFAAEPDEVLVTGVDTSKDQADGPATLTAIPGDGQVTLAWSDVSDAVGYAVYETTTNARIEVATSPYTHSGLTNGVEYVYVVTAVLEDGESAESPQARATPQAAMVVTPAGPSTLSATPGDGFVYLDWTMVSGATGYALYAQAAGAAQPTRIPVSAPPYAHTGLVNGVTYTYTVKAVFASGESMPSPQASATPTASPQPPPAPTLTIDENGYVPPNAIAGFTWNAVPGATSYKVYWQTSGPGVTTSATAITTAGTSTDTMIAACTATVYARVAAVNAVGEGPLSAEQSRRFCPGTCTRPAAYPTPTALVSSSIGDDATVLPACFPYATLGAALAGRAPGDVVAVIGTGSFAVSGLVVPTGVVLVGDPAAPSNVDITGIGGTTGDASSWAIGVAPSGRVSGVRVTAPGKGGIRVLGADVHLDHVHTIGSRDGIDARGPTYNLTVDDSLSAGNTGDGIVIAFNAGTYHADLHNSVFKSNNIGVYIDSYNVGSGFDLTGSTIACNNSVDLRVYGDSGSATITFSFATATFDSPFRQEGPPLPPQQCQIAGVEFCQADATNYALSNPTVVFPSANVSPTGATCP